MVISKVDRTIDLTSQVAKVHSRIVLKNVGTSAENSFHLAFEDNLFKHLAYFEVKTKKSDDDTLEHSKTKEGDAKGVFYKVKLPSALAPGKSANYEIESVYTHILTPFPEKIGQSEKQLVVYKANTVFYSPYKVEEQKTIVKLSSATIESFSRLKPTSSGDSTITYGPYKGSNPFRTHELRIHFENNSPFLAVNEMMRWIELSQWGNIAVEETYHMSHDGARLKGHFSRYDYQRTPTHAAIKSFKTVLPSAARDVYYRDEIGNISTSNMLMKEDSVEVEIRPRFPLFGGWQTRYYMGYNIPAYEYLHHKGDQFILKMRLADHVFDDFVVDKLVVKIVLPEGASNINMKTPYEVKRGKDELHKTYLDTTGRTVVVLIKDNVVENHIQDFELHYTFKKIQMLHEPFLCVAAFYILFISVIAMVRLDFSITKDEAKESKMKFASFVEDLLSACDRRTGVYSRMDAAIEKFKQNHDQSALAALLKKLNGEYTQCTHDVTELCSSLTKEDPETGDKLAEIQKKERERKDSMDQLVTLATKVVTGKINRNQYVDVEETAQTKRSKLAEDLDNLLSSL